MTFIKKVIRGFLNIPTIYITLFIVLLINGLMNHRMFTVRGLNNLFLQVTPIILAAMAQACVMLVNELDISIGAVISLTTVILAVTMEKIGWISLIVVMIIVILIGILNGFIVAHFRINGIVVTLATSMIFSGLALLILPIPGGVIKPQIAKIFTGISFSIPNSLILLVSVLILWKFIKNQPLGLNIYATGGNYFSAFASGISVKKSKIYAFVICAVLSCLSGVVLASKTMSGDANIAGSYSITSIAGAVLGGVSFTGGVGKMARVVAGAIVISILVNILFFLQVNSFWQYTVQGVILLVAVLMSQLNRKV